jgi:outer membrane lipoprotein-sorting protein
VAIRRARALGFAFVAIALVAFPAFPSSEEGKARPDMDPTLESVMTALSESGGVEARFRESRELAILNEPIVSSGKLYFSPPDWLARHVTEPGEARVIVRDDRVTFQDETGIQVLELGSSEVARAMVGNVSVLMRGDLETLRRQYEVAFTSKGDLWTLDLEPRDRIVRQLIERLRVDGRGNELVRMESIETSGDITRTEFLEVEVAVDFSPEARAAIFEVLPDPQSQVKPQDARGSVPAAASAP